MINKEKAMKDGILNKIMRIPFRQRVLMGYWIGDDGEERSKYLKPIKKIEIPISDDVNTEALFELCRRNDILFDVIDFKKYFDDFGYKSIVDSLSLEIVKLLKRVDCFYTEDEWQTLDYGVAKASIGFMLKKKSNKGKKASNSSRIRELVDKYKDDEIVK